MNLLLVAIVFITLLVPHPAYAYLDPGTGSVILQVLVAGVLGAIFTIKMYWGKFRTYTRSIFGKTSGASKDQSSKSSGPTSHEQE